MTKWYIRYADFDQPFTFIYQNKRIKPLAIAFIAIFWQDSKDEKFGG